MKTTFGMLAALALAFAANCLAADRILIGQSAPLTGSNADAKVLVEAIRRAGRDVTRESLYRSLAGLGRYDAGGYVVTFGPDVRHGSHYVELAVISKNGQFRF